jgi:hypothetical protein
METSKLLSNEPLKILNIYIQDLRSQCQAEQEKNKTLRSCLLKIKGIISYGVSAKHLQEINKIINKSVPSSKSLNSSYQLKLTPIKPVPNLYNLLARIMHFRIKSIFESLVCIEPYQNPYHVRGRSDNTCLVQYDFDCLLIIEEGLNAINDAFKSLVLHCLRDCFSLLKGRVGIRRNDFRGIFLRKALKNLQDRKKFRVLYSIFEYVWSRKSIFSQKIKGFNENLGSVVKKRQRKVLSLVTINLNVLKPYKNHHIGMLQLYYISKNLEKSAKNWYFKFIFLKRTTISIKSQKLELYISKSHHILSEKLLILSNLPKKILNSYLKSSFLCIVSFATHEIGYKSILQDSINIFIKYYKLYQIKKLHISLNYWKNTLNCTKNSKTPLNSIQNSKKFYKTYTTDPKTPITKLKKSLINLKVIIEQQIYAKKSNSFNKWNMTTKIFSSSLLPDFYSILSDIKENLYISMNSKYKSGLYLNKTTKALPLQQLKFN